jgi:hypothetical protein
VCKGACHKVTFRKFKGEKCVGFSFLCYFMKVQYIKLKFIYCNFFLPSHLSHNSLSLISLSSNEMHHTFIPFIYSAHGSSSHRRGHIYLELISSCGFLVICQMMFHLVAFHPSCQSIKIHYFVFSFTQLNSSTHNHSIH